MRSCDDFRALIISKADGISLFLSWSMCSRLLHTDFAFVMFLDLDVVVVDVAFIYIALSLEQTLRQRVQCCRCVGRSQESCVNRIEVELESRSWMGCGWEQG